MDNLTFDGVQQTFDITISGVPFNPPTAFAMMVSLNNVILNPGVDFSISGSQISFAQPLQH
jgi:hypothetical protein